MSAATFGMATAAATRVKKVRRERVETVDIILLLWTK
jgi:hypothetical protein